MTETTDETPDWFPDPSTATPIEPEVLPAEFVDQLDRARPVFRDLYLDARDRADGNRGFVPHEVLAETCRDHGFAGVTDALPGDEAWTVWTPKSRDTPLYAYTPNVAGITYGERELFAELLDVAGVGTERFINVLNGQKASFDTDNARSYDSQKIGGNYGVKGGRGGSDTDRFLIDIDIDYQEKAAENPYLQDIDGETLEIASAHTTTDEPGHKYVVVDGDAVEAVRDVLGRDVRNPVASFGEIRIDNQYCVAPGSAIVCGCEKCTSEDADEHGYGRYEFATPVAPVVWTVDEFCAFLRSDEKLHHAADRDMNGDDPDGTGASLPVSSDADGIVAFAETVDETVRDALNRGVAGDRSATDAFIAWALAPWVNFDEDAVEAALNEHGTSKWQTRTDDSYRVSVLSGVDARDAETATDGYDGDLPHWAVVKYAVEIGVVAESELVEKQGDGGGTYSALPSKLHYEATLEAIQSLGVDHGWDWDEGSDDVDSVEEYYNVVEEYGPDGADVFVDDAAFLIACVAARVDGGVPSDATVPDRALTPIVGPVDEVSDDTLELGREVFRELTVESATNRFLDAKRGGDQ